MTNTRIPKEWKTILTPRQYQCAILEALGWTQHEIARHLRISRSTVCTHLDNAATRITQHERDQEHDNP